MGPLAVFGITNDGLSLAVNLLLLFLVVLWLALVYWTYADARRRIDDPLLVGCATAASLFPFVGTIVYTIVRPPEYLEDRRERELEIAAAEARLAGVEQLSCPYCAHSIETSFLRCPNCLHRLKEPCRTCGKPLDPRWQICPYCEAEVGAPAPQPARQRRPRAAPEPVAAQPRAADTAERPRAAGEPRSAAARRPAGERREPAAERAQPAAAARKQEAAPAAEPKQTNTRRKQSDGGAAKQPARKQAATAEGKRADGAEGQRERSSKPTRERSPSGRDRPAGQRARP